MSESNYLEYLKDNVEGEVLFYYYNDYDGDGTCEMFALVGEAIDCDGLYEEDNLSGEIWYVNQNGVMRIENNEIIYWSSPYTFSIGVNAFIAFEKYYATGSLTYMWGVKNGRPYQPNISGKGNGLRINEYNEIEITDSTNSNRRQTGKPSNPDSGRGFPIPIRFFSVFVALRCSL